MKENNLQVIVENSGLEKSKAKIMLDQFDDYFKMASEWEIKAKSIIVTDKSQITNMKMARVGRLFLREKRIAIEKTRKSLKEQSIREGKAVDGIANILKALIAPIEEHLDRQEHFVEIKEKEEEKLKLIEEQKKQEEEQILKEQKDREEQKRIQKEHAELTIKLETEKKLAEIEHNKTIEREAEAKRKSEEEQKKLREDVQRKENEKLLAQRKHEEQMLKADQERKKAAEEIQRKLAEQASREREDKRQAEAEISRLKEEVIKTEEILKKSVNLIVCPFCKKQFDYKITEGG